MPGPTPAPRPARTWRTGLLISLVILLAVPTTRNTIAGWIGGGIGFTAGAVIALLVFVPRKR